MDLQQFIRDFESQFDDVKPGSLAAESKLESIDEWSSLQALSIIAMMDEKYGRKVTGAAVNGAKTVGELYDLVKE